MPVWNTMSTSSAVWFVVSRRERERVADVLRLVAVEEHQRVGDAEVAADAGVQAGGEVASSARRSGRYGYVHK
jgi:hypothetical protein